MGGGRLLEHRAHARLVGDVAAHGERARGGDAGERLLRAGDAGDGPALGDEQLDRGAAEIARSEDDGAPGARGAVAHVSQYPDRRAPAARSSAVRAAGQLADPPRALVRMASPDAPVGRSSHFRHEGDLLRETPRHRSASPFGRAGSRSGVESAPEMPALARVEPALRKTILAAAESPRLQRGVRRHGMRLGAARFVAGETLDDAVVVLRRLNEQRARGEHDPARRGRRERGRDARRSSTRTRTILDRIAAERLRVNVALKLTHLGLAFDEELARANIGELVAHAAGARQLHPARHGGVGVRRRDAARVPRAARGGPCERRHRPPVVPLPHARPTSKSCSTLAPNLRFVKGAYLEPPSVAYPEKSDVDAAYARLIERSLTAGGFTAIATHDETLIEHAISFAEDNDIPRTRFQFQMLYGVRSKLQLDLVRQGYDVLVATPTAPTGTAYLMRRLAERPANVLFIARNLVRR